MNDTGQPTAARERNPDTAADRRWARAGYQRGEFDAAAALCRRILRADPGDYEAAGMLAEALRRSGKLDEEIVALKSAAGPDIEDSAPLVILGGLQRAANDAAGAVETLEQAAAIDPDSPAVRLALGGAYYDMGDHAAAGTVLARAMELDSSCAPAHYLMGNMHSQAGAWTAAIEAYSAAIEADPEFVNARLELAYLLYRRRKDKELATDLGRAADLVLGAIQQGAGGFEPLLLAGKILIELERFDEALTALEAAAATGEKNSDLYVALSVAYTRKGEFTKARRISRRHLREFPVGSRLSPRPEAQVLVLEFLAHNAFTMAVYGPNTHAHANAIAAFRPARVSLHHRFIQGVMVDQMDDLAKQYDVVYNDVANAEVNIEKGYSRVVRELLDRTGLPVVNAPEAIDQTARDRNYQRLHGLEHLICPRTVTVTPQEGKLDAAVEQIMAEFTFPMLVRRTSFHRSGWMIKADDVEGLRAALGQFAGNPCYVIQYHESRHPMGMFLKYRVIFIGGQFFPGRMNISGSWMVGPTSRRPGDRKLTEGNSEFQEAEERWLADPAGVIGQANIDALHKADAIIGLDNYGMDIGIAGDGRVILFEANPCMNFLSIQRHVPKYPYLGPTANAINDAMADMIVARAGKAGA